VTTVNSQARCLSVADHAGRVDWLAGLTVKGTVGTAVTARPNACMLLVKFAKLFWNVTCTWSNGALSS
jgi:hypothetical protein